MNRYRLHLLDQLPTGSARSLHVVSEYVKIFGARQNINLSVLFTLKCDTKCTKQPQQYKILEAGQALGMVNALFSLGQGMGKPLPKSLFSEWEYLAHADSMRMLAL